MTLEEARKPNKNSFYIKGLTKKMCGFLLDLLFPIECLGCTKPGEWFCKNCFRKLEYSDEKYCLSCYKESALGEFCFDCQKNFFLDGVLIAGSYKNKKLAEIIRTMKYKFNPEISRTLGDYLSLFVKNILSQNKQTRKPAFLFDGRNTLLIPVPLHKKRLKWRGFNQAELLCQVIQDNLMYKINLQDLKRKNHLKAQAKLRGKKRYENLKDNFFWQGESLKEKNVIMVDDIATTGTTLNECARALKNAGAEKVWGLVVAKG